MSDFAEYLYVKHIRCALCKLGKLEKPVKMFEEIQTMGCAPTVASYNTLIVGHCNQGLLSTAMNLKILMEKSGLIPNYITFNTLFHGLCKGRQRKLHTLLKNLIAKKLFPNSSTFYALISGQYERKNSECSFQLYILEKITRQIKNSKE